MEQEFWHDKKRVDLHNHTVLCNHATGSVDDYIEKAIELGINEYGFSMPCSNEL